MKNKQILCQQRVQAHGVHEGYFGRTSWDNASMNKTIKEVGSLDESTGGRGTTWLIRGVEGVTTSERLRS